jgi:hypothetical protein
MLLQHYEWNEPCINNDIQTNRERERERVLFVLAFQLITLYSILKHTHKRKRVYQLTKHVSLIHCTHDQMNVNYNSLYCNYINLVQSNVHSLCIMKIDDSSRILLDKEKFRKHAATVESKRFIMSYFSFHSLYFYFPPFFYILSHLREIFAPLPIHFHCKAKSWDPGLRTAFCRNQRDILIHRCTLSDWTGYR